MIPKAVERGGRAHCQNRLKADLVAGHPRREFASCAYEVRGEAAKVLPYRDARPPRHIWRSGTNWCAWPFWVEQRKGSGSR
jgi:hypothetical protein